MPGEQNNWTHSFTYKLEFGLQFPWRVIDHFWFIGRIAGIEPFLLSQNDAQARNHADDGTESAEGHQTYFTGYRL